MKTDEQGTAVLRLIRERIETKRRSAVLKNELRAAGRFLYDIGGALKHASPGKIGNRIDYLLPKLRVAQDICGLGQVQARLEELKKLEMRLADLNRIASEMGID
jgi:hypothetical protein